MEKSVKLLTKRADGYHETVDGLVAITMTAMTAVVGNVVWLAYQSAFLTDPIRVEWNLGDKAQLFPEELAAALIRQGFAIMPDDEAIEWLEESYEVPEDAPTEPTLVPEVAPETPLTPPAATTQPETPEEPTVEPVASTETPQEPAVEPETKTVATAPPKAPPAPKE